LVAVIDAGIVRDHPDLPGGNIDLWYPSTGSLWSPESSVEVDHGTSVVGIIIANGQADFAATGLAPSCAVLACDVMDWNFDSICGAVDHATRHDSVRVLSLSFSYYTDAWPPIPNNEGELAAALQRAQDTGVLICAAAGNTFADDRMTIGFPACYPGVMVVGAIDEYDDTDNIPGTTRWFSRYRPTSYEGVMARVSVVAPGYEVLTTRIGPWGEYLAAGFAGTSASTPQVAALAGLLFNRHPHLTAGDVRRIIESTAEKLDTYTFEWDREGDPSTRHPKIGHGCIDVTAALTLADVYPESPAVVTVGDRLELRLTVRNRGPIAAIAVSVRVWVLRPDEPWKLVADPGREGASDLYTYDAATPLKPEASQTVVDTLQPDGPQPVSVFVLPQGSRVLIVVDAANDHAFHRALASQPASGGNHRFYNNIALRQVEG
jgi:subtilisin family serine protease